MSGISFRMMIAAALVLGLGALVGPTTALAQFEVQKPEVRKGDFELEYLGAYFNGLPSLPIDAARQGHELAAYYGLTEWLEIKGAVEAERERTEDGSFNSLKLSEIEGQAKIELLPIEGDGFGISFLGRYGESVVSNEDESEIVFGPILKAASGPFSITANLFPVYSFDIKETEIEFEEPEEEGEEATAEIEVERTPDHWNFDYALQVKHQTWERVALGAEAYGELEDISNDNPDSGPDKHRMGPVVYVSLGEGHGHGGHGDEAGHSTGDLPSALLAFGVLFGLNDDTSDVALKWDAEFHF